MKKTKVIDITLIAVLSAIIFITSPLYAIFFGLTVLTISFKFKYALTASIIASIANLLIFGIAPTLMINIAIWPLYVILLKLVTVKLNLNMTYQNKKEYVVKSIYLFLATLLLTLFANFMGLIVNGWLLDTDVHGAIWFYLGHSLLNAGIVLVIGLYLRRRILELLEHLSISV